MHCILLLAAVLLSSPAAFAQGTSLRFHGTGSAGLGAQDFTFEFWMKGSLADNPASAIACGFGENWIHGNVVFERGRREPGGRDWGLSLGEGRLAFGVTNGSRVSTTLCGTTTLLDGEWHHVAFARRRVDGFLWLWVDGALDASGDGPDGDMSYPGDEGSGSLVLGDEKHDAGPQSSSFAGWLDEIRFSNALRYDAPFSRPTAPFSSDSATVALYHLEEGSDGDVPDVVGAPGSAWSSETPFAAVYASRVDVRGLPQGAVFDAYPNPSLGQTILFARFPDGRSGSAAVTIHDARGGARASVEGTIDGGSTMMIWDGRGHDGSELPPGVYFAKLVAGETALSAKFVLP